MKCLYTLFSLFVLTFSVVSAQNGITYRGKQEKFTIYKEEMSTATQVTENNDGSVSWVATAAGGAGGGLSFYVRSDKQEINIANYESIDIELDYAPVNGKWNGSAKNPGFVLRILPYDSTGMFGGYEDLEYITTNQKSGTLKHTAKIPADFADKIIASSDFDSILGFGIKFDDYQKGNTDGDQLKVTLKSVVFHEKSGAPEDTPFDDGLDDSQRGTVLEINYPTKDYTGGSSRYNKHGWVYLPAGYDENDKDTKYPLFVLLHGFGQNENTWGLSNKGRGGKIKGYMDRGMASGEVGRFILVVVTGVASPKWGPNGAGNDVAGFNAFKGELRDDILPYMRKNFNVKEGRDNVALAGLSMGGGQTFNIGIGECLDLISNFAGYSAAVFGTADEFMRNVDNKFRDLKIHNLYMTCGTADDLVYQSYPGFTRAFSNWSKVENFKEYTYPGGTHDFPVWFKGFNDFIHMIFSDMRQKSEPVKKPEPTQVQQPQQTLQPVKGSCSQKILLQGYKCCSPGCVVYYTDSDGTWGVEDGDWCGCEVAATTCTGAQGFPCCTTTTEVYFTDADGQWGIENNDWCLLPWIM